MFQYYKTLMCKVGLVSGIALSMIGNAGAEEAPVFVGDPASITIAMADSYFGVGTAHTATVTSIKAVILKKLAYNLNGDVDKIFEYVRNGIEVTPQFGLHHGALGAIRTGHGTPFDQAELLVELLQETGHAATLEIGNVTVSLSDLASWFGFNNSANAVTTVAMDEFLSAGGFPYTRSGSNYTIKHAWVVLGGAVMDASYKPHNFYARVAFEADSGVSYSTSGVVSSSGATYNSNCVGTVSCVANFSASGLKGKLDNLTDNVDAYIKNNAHDKSMKQFVGGYEIIPDYDITSGDYSPSVLSYGSSFSASSGIPNNYRTRIVATYGLGGAGNVITVYVDDLIFPQVDFDNDGVKVIKEDDEMGYWYHTLAPVTQSFTSAKIDHPYAADGPDVDVLIGDYMDHEITTVGGSFGVFTGMPNGATQGEAYSWTNKQDLSNGYGFPDGVGYVWDDYSQIYVRSEGYKDDFYFQKLGNERHRWMKSIYSAFGQWNEIVGSNVSSRTQLHHLFFVMANDSAASPLLSTEYDQYTFIDAILGLSSTNVANSAAKRDASIAANLNGLSMLEGRLMAGEMNQEFTATTPDIFYMNSIFYDVKNTTDLITLNPISFGYSSTTNSYLTDYLADNHAVLLPQLASVGTNVVSPDGAASAFWVESTALTTGDSYPLPGVHSLVNGTVYKGGGGGGGLQSVKDMLGFAVDEFKSSAPAIKGAPSISPSGGKVTYTGGADFKVGSGDFPYSLSLQRTFTGSSKEGFGRGWTTNFNIGATLTTDVSLGLGGSGARSAAAAIVSIYAATDLWENAVNAREKVVSIASLGWLSDQFDNNAVHVSNGPSSESFIRLRKGKDYYSPTSLAEVRVEGTPRALKSKTNMVETIQFWGNDHLKLYRVSETGDVQYFFEGLWSCWPGTEIEKCVYNEAARSYKVSSWAFPSGIELNFTYDAEQGSQKLLSVVDNGIGHRLNFVRYDFFNEAAEGIFAGGCDPEVEICYYDDDLPWGVTETSHIKHVATSDGRIFQAHNGSVFVPVDFSVYGNRLRLYSFAGETYTYDAVVADNPLLSTVNGRNGLMTVGYNLDANPQFTTANWRRAESIEDAENIEHNIYSSKVISSTRLSEAIEGSAFEYVTQFNGNGKVAQRTDPLGRTRIATYDGLGRTKTVTMPEKNSVEFVYSPKHKMVQKKTIDKNFVETLLVEAGYVDKVITFPMTGTGQANITLNLTDYLVDANRSTGGVPAANDRYDFGYDALGRLITMTTPITANPRAVTTFEYTTGTVPGLISKITDPKLMETVNTYDSVGNLRSSTVDAGGENLITRYEYDAVGNMIRKYDPEHYNAPPNAGGDWIGLFPDEDYTFDPRYNDSDADGDPITITSITQGSLGLAYIVNDGTGLRYKSIGIEGEDSFTYTITDGRGNYDTATISVTISDES